MRFDLDPHRPDWGVYLRCFVWGRDLRDSRRPIYWILKLPWRWRLMYRMSGLDNQRLGRLYLYRRDLTTIEALLLAARRARR